jgi:hypothetical protein
MMPAVVPLFHQTSIFQAEIPLRYKYGIKA